MMSRVSIDIAMKPLPSAFKIAQMLLNSYHYHSAIVVDFNHTFTWKGCEQIRDALRDLVPFAPFKKCEKHP